MLNKLINLEEIKIFFQEYPIFLQIIYFVIILVISYISYFIAKYILNHSVKKLVFSTKNKWDNFFFEHKVFHSFIHIIPTLLIYYFTGFFNLLSAFFSPILQACIAIQCIFLLDRMINAIVSIYNNYSISKQKPIQGYAQLVKIFLYVLGGIIAIALFLGESPWFFISGLGALTAVLLLIFKDTLLSFMAGIQITTSDMIQVGDWISAPQFDADGDVIELGLYTIKVQNWDNTISMVPTHNLTQSYFKNWRGMSNSGGRRIKRALYIDQMSIRFCNETMLQRFEKINILQPYLTKKSEEIKQHNENIKGKVDILNNRVMTNIGVFRAYVEAYIKQQPYFHSSMTFLIRQLKPGPTGLPLEIYFFSNDIKWANYEGIQSDLFDHLLAAIPEFELRVFQEPTGNDLKGLIHSISNYKT